MSSAATDDDSLDGTPIKSVSSLRSRFENMGKNDPAPTPVPIPSNASVPTPAPTPPQNPPSRSISPAAKPDRPPASTKPTTEPPPGVTTLRNNLVSQEIPVRSSSPRAPPRPPTVTIQPPQSPAPGALLETPKVSPFANPEILENTTSNSRPNAPPPPPEPRKSPRAGMKPPSPPPPRRSTEIKKPLPPPVNRAEKPSARPKLAFPESRPGAQDRLITKPEVSPFNSPSGSVTTDEESVPPPMPARPLRSETSASPTLNRSKSLHVGSTFEPPPVHPSVVNRRREQEAAFVKPQQLTRQLTGPSLPSRPQYTSIEPPPIALRRPPATSAKPLPPKPPRPPVATNLDNIPVAHHRFSTPLTPQHQRPSTYGHQSHQSMIEPGTYELRTPVLGAPPPPPRVLPPQVQQTSAASLGLMISGPSTKAEPDMVITAYPDVSNVNRQPPFLKPGIPEITTKYDARVFDVCGEYVCCGGSMTRAWSMLDGSELCTLPNAEGVRGTAIVFKPAPNPNDEGSRVWVGTNMGELMELDLFTQEIACSRPGAHNKQEITKIYRYQNQLWTLDETGILHIWEPDKTTVPNLSNSPSYTYRLPRGHTFSMVVDNQLWYASAKDLYIFAPTPEGNASCQLTSRPLSYESAGEILCGTTIRSQPDLVYLGHSDGKVSVYVRNDFSLLCVVNLNSFKINTMGGIGDKLWAGFNSGKICVFDVTTSPWSMKKEWQAHDNPVIKLIPDATSMYRIGRYQVVTLGADNKLRAWDGLLKDDILDAQMRSIDTEYCNFDALDVQCLTWNAGASTPSQIQHSIDNSFFPTLIQESGCPDIMIFGFQELVDLEDKTATAKRLFKSSKKKDDKKDMSHAYRDWRDFLQRTLDDYMPSNQPYYALHTATLVGLFTCIFVKASLRDRIHDLHATDVKRGMGGYHGNKGAIVVRFMVDDSSLCFINCHLAAGQSQANNRHNDVAAILEGQILPIERNTAIRPDHYVGGGDGTMIMDHELILLNGDLNYRIDTMSRDTVVMAVKSNNFAKLLERDQLLSAKRRNPSFKLRAFDEMPIEFAPTYKYDVGTDTYDTSEKKRSPAWCDRLLHRGHGRIIQSEYRRHEVRASDHRPVSGRFKFYVKEIDQTRKALANAKCLQLLDELRAKIEEEEKLAYLTQVCGLDLATSNTLIQQRSAKRDMRSSSRPRDVVPPPGSY